MEVKEILKSRREELGLTLKDVAKMCGVSESTVSRWESGDIENMKRNRIVLLAEALRLSPPVIMGWDKSYQKNDDLADLIEAAAGCTPEQIRTAIILLNTLKANN